MYTFVDYREYPSCADILHSSRTHQTQTDLKSEKDNYDSMTQINNANDECFVQFNSKKKKHNFYHHRYSSQLPLIVLTQTPRVRPLSSPTGNCKYHLTSAGIISYLCTKATRIPYFIRRNIYPIANTTPNLKKYAKSQNTTLIPKHYAEYP